MHASALSNVARRRLVHGAVIQSVAASSATAPIPTASTVQDVPNAPLHPSRSRKVVRDSDKDETIASREASTSSATYRTSARQSGQGLGRSVPTSLLSSSADKRPHIRALHTSSVARAADPNSFEARRDALPTSAWSRPPRPSQDADDNIVPTYYVERKKQRVAISHRKEEEGGLMNDLSAGILGDGLAASTKVREEKMPVEVRLPDGTVAHPSGFEPPTAETEFHPVAAKVDAGEHPLLTTVKQPWGEREAVEAAEGGAEPIQVDKAAEEEWIKRMVSDGNGGHGVVSGVSAIGAEPLPSTTFERAAALAARADDPDSVVPRFYVERKRQRDAVTEREQEERDLMHELLGDEVAAQMRDREEKIPVEVVLDDGTVAHPSGFVPPTAETDFHPVAAKTGDAPKQAWIEVLGAGVESQNGSS